VSQRKDWLRSIDWSTRMSQRRVSMRSDQIDRNSDSNSDMQLLILSREYWQRLSREYWQRRSWRIGKRQWNERARNLWSRETTDYYRRCANESVDGWMSLESKECKCCETHRRKETERCQRENQVSIDTDQVRVCECMCVCVYITVRTMK
jgi:hypothetical protein